jgi:hypothetical protein
MSHSYTPRRARRAARKDHALAPIDDSALSRGVEAPGPSPP